MATVAEFTLPPSSFPLGAVFETHPDARFELDRVVPSGDTAMPYFWVHDDVGGVHDTLGAIPELRTIRLIDDLGDRGLFRAEWEPEHLGIMLAIAESGVTVVSATGDASGWRFELRAEGTDQIPAFTDLCEEFRVPVDLNRLSRLAETDDGEFGLTDEQREALLLAYERGYYDEPRTVDQADLAAELGISRQAFGARLRRAYRNFIASSLA